MKSKNRIGLTLSLVLLSTTSAIAQPKPTTSPGLAPSPTISTQQQKELEKLQQEKEIRNTVQTEVDRAFSRTTTMLNILLVVLTILPIGTAFIIWFLRRSVVSQLVTETKEPIEKEISKAKTDAEIKLQQLETEILQVKTDAINQLQNIINEAGNLSQRITQDIENAKNVALNRINSMVFEVQEKTRIFAKLIEIMPENLFENVAPEIKQKIQELITQLKSLESNSPDLVLTPDDYFNQGNALFFTGDYEGAIKSYDQAIEMQSFHEVWYNRGVVLLSLERNQDALASFNQALELKPDFYPGWYNRGEVLVRLTRYQNLLLDSELSDEHKQQYEDAITSYEKALEIKPDFHEAWYNRAECYALIKKVDLAIEDLKQAIQLNPEYKTKAQNDPDFEKIREDERFKQLIED